MNTLLDTLSKIRLFRLKYKVQIAFFGGVISWILFEALAGIIGNSASAYWASFQIWQSRPSTVNNSYMVIVGVTGVLTGLLVMWILQKLTKKGDHSSSIVEQSMLIGKLRSQEIHGYYLLLSNLSAIIQAALTSVSNKDELDNLIQDYFSAIFLSLGKDSITGAGIIVPDDSAPEWLYFWKMNAGQVLSPKRFYIGSEENVNSQTHPRGVAGSVYLNDKASIVNIIDRASGDTDAPAFHKFDMKSLKQPRYSVPYDSFICLPIHRDKKVIGVLSIESQKRHSFDAYSVEFLQPIADQLGTIFYISDRIEGRQK